MTTSCRSDADHGVGVAVEVSSSDRRCRNDAARRVTNETNPSIGFLPICRVRVAGLADANVVHQAGPPEEIAAGFPKASRRMGHGDDRMCIS